MEARTPGLNALRTQCPASAGLHEVRLTTFAKATVVRHSFSEGGRRILRTCETPRWLARQGLWNFARTADNATGLGISTCFSARTMMLAAVVEFGRAAESCKRERFRWQT